MARLYVIPLPDGDAQSSDDRVASRVEQAGLLEEGGVATEPIGTDDVDVTVRGQWRFGERFSKKVARELESLAASGYTALPLFEAESAELGRKTGYYELEAVDVSPAHPSSEDVFEYTVGLGETGTRETHWRAVKTSVADVETGLATGEGGLVGIPAAARKTKWFDAAEGRASADPVDTVSAEFGDVDRYDPGDAPFDDPTLLYELDYEREGRVDVRVWDDRDREKFWRFESDVGGAWGDGAWSDGRWAGTATVGVTQWSHVFHPASELSGDPVLDNGLRRLRFAEDTGDLEARLWDADTEEWEADTFDQSDYDLLDADIERIGPADVQVYAEFEATADGSLAAAILSLQRGHSDILVREPDNQTLPSDLEAMLEPIASDQTTDASPDQTVIARSETK